MMFKITPAHEAEFERYRRDRFIEEMALGSRDFLPEGPPFLTPADRLTGSRFVFNCAEAAGYETRGACFFWLNMATLFGSNFSSDPQYSVIAPSTKKPDHKQELAYLDDVYRQVTAYASRVFGGRANTLFTRALERFLTVMGEPDRLDQAQTLDALYQIYPQKVDAHHDVYLRKMETGVYRAKAQRILNSDKHHAATLVAGLEMFFGHRFEDDPLKPWLGRQLDACRLTPPEESLALEPLIDHTRAWLNFEPEDGHGS